MRLSVRMRMGYEAKGNFEGGDVRGRVRIEGTGKDEGEGMRVRERVGV